jgi:hypothetical protein
MCADGTYYAEIAVDVARPQRPRLVPSAVVLPRT